MAVRESGAHSGGSRVETTATQIHNAWASQGFVNSCHRAVTKQHGLPDVITQSCRFRIQSA